MYLLDTNVVSELRRRAHADAGVVAWINAMPEDLLAISVVTVAEIEAGVRRVERRDAGQGALIRRWAEGVFAAFAGRILAIDADAARICGALHVPDPRPDHDAWIAATALARGYSVVTRNTRDFAPMGVRTVNPWTGA
jgi:predicted nucleic acid-binding protein